MEMTCIKREDILKDGGLCFEQKEKKYCLYIVFEYKDNNVVLYLWVCIRDARHAHVTHWSRTFY